MKVHRWEVLVSATSALAVAESLSTLKHALPVEVRLHPRARFALSLPRNMIYGIMGATPTPAEKGRRAGIMADDKRARYMMAESTRANEPKLPIFSSRLYVRR